MEIKKPMMVMMSVAVATALFVSGCNGEDGATGATGTDGTDANKIASKLQFEEISTPVTDTEKVAINASPKATNLVNGYENSVGFTKLMATADTNNGEVYGLVKDHLDQPLTFDDGSPYICNGTNAGVGSGLDFVSFLNDPDGSGKMYMVSQFECEIGAMYINELEQDSDGVLTPKADTLEFISQAAYHGGWVHCAGMKTPWESHLGSEEYEPDARSVEDNMQADGTTGNSYYDELAKFFGGDANQSNPYFWGWSPEVQVVGGAAQYTKHYAMGRFSHELSYVMPDRKTVYMTDDGTNDVIFMFIADTEEDLSSGTLYAAKWNQTSAVGTNGGSADISWLNLGSATDTQVKAAVDAEISFSDIFNSEVPAADFTCPTAGFTFINTEYGQECLQVNTANYSANVISRLESRRYAAIMGATSEFRKMEGFTYDPEHGVAYISMSAIERGIEAGYSIPKDSSKYDDGGNNDINLQYNKCGAVYAMEVSPTQRFGSDYVVENMTAVVKGMPTTYPVGHEYEGNSCSVEGISNPDNVTYLPGSNILTIGEDTSKHINNVIWSYDVETGALVRTMTMPQKAETTSPFWYKDFNGFGYMSAVTQHPIDDGSGSSENESFVGYYGPFIDLP